NHGVVQAILNELGEPLMSVSLIIEGHEFFDIYDVCSVLEKKVDVIIDDGYCPPEPTSVIDFSEGTVKIARHGAGDTSLIVQ
ncbi:MAG: Sua5/YciO/YrdC/YwlC family protein, partial [Candidatus Thioglobus sp.]